MKPGPTRRPHAAASIVVLVLSACSTSVSPATPSQPSASAPPAIASVSPSPSIIVIPLESPEVSLEPVPSGEPSPEPTTATPEPTEELTGTAGPGCGTGAKGFFAHRSEVPDVLHFGGATIEFATALIGLRNGTYTGDDAIPAGLGLTPDEIAVKVTPGTHIILRGDGMTITKPDVRVVPWATVEFSGGLGSSAAAPTELAWRLRADGSISVSAPSGTGDYLVEFGPRWHTECLVGDGSAYSRIKVVAG
jgi:hypothetical protein